MKKLVKLDNLANVSIINQIYNYIDPTYIYIPSNNNYKIKDYVFKNSFIDNNIVSISGFITDIKEVIYNKKKINVYKINNDFKENSREKIKKEKIKNRDELNEYLDSYYFNDITKQIKEKKDIKEIVVASIDEEVYSLKEFMTLSTYYKEIIETLNYLLKIFNLTNGIIATKNTDAGSIKNVKSIIGTYPNIKITLLPDKYLIGMSNNLCDYLNILEENTLILKTSEILNLYYLLIKGKLSIDTIVTISGNNINKSLVINTRIGTCLKEIIDKYIKIEDNDYDIYINGYLNGYKVDSIDNIIITKEIHTIVINKKEREEECINCGACRKICPYKINVKKCYFEKRFSKKCIGCGLCNYICPANLKLKEVVEANDEEENN